MADQKDDLSLAIIAAGVLASGEVPIGPETISSQEAPNWGVFAEQLRVGGGNIKNHAGLRAVEAIARHLHERLWQGKEIGKGE